MKKSLLTIAFLLFISTSSAFSRSRFFDLEYGDYNCIKNGETCEYYTFESGSGGYGNACPLSQKGESVDEHFDRLADFLTSEYCHFTPTRIKKYECSYDFGHLTVYRKDGRVFSVTGSFPKEMSMDDTYEPSHCTQVQMKNKRKSNISQGLSSST